MTTNNSIYAGEWQVKSGIVKVTGISDNWKQWNTEVYMNFDTITAPYGFGYHCSELAVVSAKSTNESANNDTKVTLKIMGFQVIYRFF